MFIGLLKLSKKASVFQFHEKPNPNCPVGANIEVVLELILLRAQEAMESVLREITMEELVTVLAQKIG